MRVPHFVGPLAVSLLVASLGFACSDDESNTSPGTDAGNDSPGNPETSTPDAGTDTSTNDTGTDAPATSPIGVAPFAIVYAGTQVGIDARFASAATFSGNGLSQYKIDDPAEERTNGSAKVVDTGVSGSVAWGRWNDGLTGGPNDNAVTLPANGGFHYVIGRPLVPVPASGGGTFTLAGKTPVAVSDGSLATGTASGTLAVAYGGEAGTKIGLTLTLDLPGDFTYQVTTNGGSADPSMSEISGLYAPRQTNPKVYFAAANPPITVNGGGACTGQPSCRASINGFLGEDHVGLVVHLYRGSGGAPKSVSAAFVFKK